MSGSSKSSLLADLIQAVGGMSQEASNPDSDSALSEDSRAVASITPGTPTSQQNQWMEYDGQGEGAVYAAEEGGTGSDAADASAIKALLDLQAGGRDSATPTHAQRYGFLQLLLDIYKVLAEPHHTKVSLRSHGCIGVKYCISVVSLRHKSSNNAQKL